MKINKVPLFDGGFAIVDAADFKAASKFRWHRHKGRFTDYARSESARKRTGAPIYLHRLLTGAAKGLEVDHKNRNGLDCRRSNMVVTSRSRNALNSKLSSRSTSGIKGVSWSKNAGKWMAHIKVDGVRKHLGYFSRKSAAGKVVGDFRRLQFEISV